MRSLILLCVLALAACTPAWATDKKPALNVVDDAPQTRFNCTFTTTATVSTAITGCLSPGAGVIRYIASIQIGGGVATGAAAPATLQYGTGTNCGTGTTVIYRCDHPATSGCHDMLGVPIFNAAATDLCILDAATGTKNINIQGFTGP